MDCYYCQGAAVVRARYTGPGKDPTDFVPLCGRCAGTCVGKVPTFSVDHGLELQPIPKPPPCQHREWAPERKKAT